jgi:Phage integrase family
VRIGNWLTVDQSKTLLGKSPSENLRGKRDRAILALLIGCGLRRAELVGLGTEDFQIREGHWVIADLVGKGKPEAAANDGHGKGDDRLSSHGREGGGPPLQTARDCRSRAVAWCETDAVSRRLA